MSQTIGRPLVMQLGHERGTALMVKHPGELEERTRVERNIIAGRVSLWRRLGVLSGGGDAYRFFVLEPGDSPVLLISAGVGATPVLAMLHELSGARSGRDVWWLHGARSRAQEPFAEESQREVAHGKRPLRAPERSQVVPPSQLSITPDASVPTSRWPETVGLYRRTWA